MTVTALAASKPPSAVVTVMVALPADTPVTTPEGFTVAIPLSLDNQVTLLLVASSGKTAAVSIVVAPTSTDALVGLTDTPVTATVCVLPPVPITSRCDQGYLPT